MGTSYLNTADDQRLDPSALVCVGAVTPDVRPVTAVVLPILLLIVAVSSLLLLSRTDVPGSSAASQAANATIADQSSPSLVAAQQLAAQRPLPAFIARQLGSSTETSGQPTVHQTDGALIAWPTVLTGATVITTTAKSRRSVGVRATGVPAAARLDHVGGVRYPTRDYDVVQVPMSRGVREFTVVRRHLGTRTWHWQLAGGHPSLTGSGDVVFDTGARIAAPHLLDSSGRPLAGRSLVWTLSGMNLSLRVNDGGLALPYVIDPDTTAPSILFSETLSVTNPQYQWWIPSSSTYYVNSNQTGTLKVNMQACDPESQISAVNYPTLGAGWTAGGAVAAGAPSCAAAATVNAAQYISRYWSGGFGYEDGTGVWKQVKLWTSLTCGGCSGPANWYGIAADNTLVDNWFDRANGVPLNTCTAGCTVFPWKVVGASCIQCNGIDHTATLPAPFNKDGFIMTADTTVTPTETGTYTFRTVSDDGVRVYLTDTTTGTTSIVVSEWTAHAPQPDGGQFVLTAGRTYNVRIEYYERGGNKSLALVWSKPSAGTCTWASVSGGQDTFGGNCVTSNTFNNTGMTFAKQGLYSKFVYLVSRRRVARNSQCNRHE